MKLILASQSAARKTMLANAGLSFEAIPADIDERAIEEGSPADIAQKLAFKKACSVSVQNPDALVIGSDQVLEFQNQILHKARTPEAAKEKLGSMGGQSHTLISAVSIVQNEQELWNASQTAILKMHDFNEEFLDQYCEKAGDALTQNVGAYALEGIGVQLFDSIEGDYFYNSRHASFAPAQISA